MRPARRISNNGANTMPQPIHLNPEDVRKLIDFLDLLSDYIYADPNGAVLIGESAEAMIKKLKGAKQ
jgi:hypothetical protein